MIKYLLCGIFPYSRDFFKLFTGCGRDFPDIPERGKKRFLPGGADPGDVVQDGTKVLMCLDRAEIRDRETMRLIPYPLQKKQ